MSKVLAKCSNKCMLPPLDVYFFKLCGVCLLIYLLYLQLSRRKTGSQSHCLFSGCLILNSALNSLLVCQVIASVWGTLMNAIGLEILSLHCACGVFDLQMLRSKNTGTFFSSVMFCERTNQNNYWCLGSRWVRPVSWAARKQRIFILVPILTGYSVFASCVCGHDAV